MASYPPEPELSRARYVRRRSLIIIALVALALFFAFWYAFSYYRASDTKPSATAKATCSPYDAKVMAPSKVTVNVYNSTSRNGLAASVSKQLTTRGYVIGKVENDPLNKALKTVGEVRYGSKGSAQAKLAATTMPKGTKLVKDSRKDTSVDVVLGAGFKALATAPTTTTLPMCPAPTES